MGLRINTNVQSISAQRNLKTTKRNLDSNLRKLSSGERITRAADDAAGLAISENLKSEIRSIRQAKRNADDGISLVQTAEGGLQEISNIIIRLRELAVQAATDTLGDTERGFSDIEFQQLKDEMQRIALSSQFNGRKLLDGTGGLVDIQVGTRATFLLVCTKIPDGHDLECACQFTPQTIDIIACSWLCHVIAVADTAT